VSEPCLGWAASESGRRIGATVGLAVGWRDQPACRGMAAPREVGPVARRGHDKWDLSGEEGTTSGLVGEEGTTRDCRGRGHDKWDLSGKRARQVVLSWQIGTTSGDGERGGASRRLLSAQARAASCAEEARRVGSSFAGRVWSDLSWAIGRQVGLVVARRPTSRTGWG